MADNQRIEDLRRRVQKDPASIAFAQLAEELRRSGQLQESVDSCRAGLALHPSYLSARVTLGRALVELGRLDEAADELGVVLRSAPENLAAMRAMAEVHQRRGDLSEALSQYRAALTIARNDPDLEETVADLARTVDPQPPAAASADHLSQNEFLQHLPEVPAAARPLTVVRSVSAPAPEPVASAEPIPDPHPVPDLAATTAIVPPPAPPATDPEEDVESARATRTVVALERWLDAINGARLDRRA
jgi:tetratricopeptide (TPR) repeat protein